MAIRAWATVAITAIVAFVAVMFWPAGPADDAPAAAGAQSATTSTATVPLSGSAQQETVQPSPEPALRFSTFLLAEAGVSADPASVRVGLAYVSEEARTRHFLWQQAGAEGAGPSDVRELAEVDRWLDLSAERLDDGRVHVRPVDLPAASVYVLQAKGNDGLRYYRSRFGAEAPPTDVSPVVGSGLQVDAADSATGLRLQLLRRGEQPEAATALWQAILQQEAPQLEGLFQESGLTIQPGTKLTPLPPSTFDAVVWIGAAEVLRQPVTLAPGVVSTLQLDAEKVEIAKSQTVLLEVELRAEGNRAPIPDVALTWQGPNGDVFARTDAQGRALLGSVLAGHEAWLTLEFPEQQQGGLPLWPVRRLEPITVPQPNKLPVSRTYRQGIEIPALQWLLLVGEGQDGVRVGGQPFPVYSLQRALPTEQGAWQDLGSDHFISTADGLAVSIDATGQYRVLKAASPWSLATSTSASFAKGSRSDTTRRAYLQQAAMKTLRLQLLDSQGVPLAGQTVTVASATRSLPAAEVNTDAQGWLELPNATDTPVELSVGELQARVAPLKQSSGVIRFKASQ